MGVFRKIGIVLFLMIVLSLGVLSLSFTDRHVPLLGGQELSSPGDWVQQDQVKVYRQMVVLEIPNTTWARFTNTNSMDPVFDEDAHALEILPSDPRKIKVGDIISYQTAYGVLIHRVIDVREDNEGIYYIVQGDNSPFRDPFNVRFQDVRGVVVAIVY